MENSKKKNNSTVNVPENSKELKKKNELSDDDLEQAAGGSILNALGKVTDAISNEVQEVIDGTTSKEQSPQSEEKTQDQDPSLDCIWM